MSAGGTDDEDYINANYITVQLLAPYIYMYINVHTQLRYDYDMNICGPVLPYAVSLELPSIYVICDYVLQLNTRWYIYVRSKADGKPA